MNPFLSQIRAALPDDILRERMEGRQALRVAGAIADPDSLWTLADLEQLLTRGAIAPAEFKLFAGDIAVDLESAGIAANSRLRPLTLRSLALQGSTLVANNLHRHCPRLWDLACAMESWVGGKVTIGAIASFGPSSLRLHYDSEDLVILQMTGAKQWRFFGDAVRASSRQVPAAASRKVDAEPEPPMSLELKMERGDLLYVSSGLRHRCVPEGVSLHLGILIEHSSGADLITTLARLARSEDLFHEPLPRFLGADAIAQRGEVLKARLTALVNAVDPVAWLDERLAGQGRATGLDLVPLSLDTPGAIATMGVSLPPAPASNGKLKAGELLLERTPGIVQSLEMLGEGPRPVADLLAAGLREPLEMLVKRGVVRLR